MMAEKGYSLQEMLEGPIKRRRVSERGEDRSWTTSRWDYTVVLRHSVLAGTTLCDAGSEPTQLHNYGYRHTLSVCSAAIDQVAFEGCVAI